MAKSRKSPTKLMMGSYDALPINRYRIVELVAVDPSTESMVRLTFIVHGDSRQAGRQIHHDMPAVLAPSSPLAGFLGDAFGVSLRLGDTVDLETYIGQRLKAKFSTPDATGHQTITAFRSIEKTKLATTNSVDHAEEGGTNV